MKSKRIISLLILVSLFLSACGSQGTSSDTTAADSTSASTEATTEAPKEYEFTTEYAGTEFRVLNAGDIYSMHAQIDREEANGDALNDVMYERCRTLEDKMGITFVETNKHVDSGLANTAQTVILAGEDAYDTIYIPSRDMYKFTSQGYLYNLLEYDEIQLDEAWWIQSYNDASIIDDKLYAAAGYSQLMVIDSLWCLFFNESMMDDLKLDYPYQLVRDGKWTIDRFNEYISAGAQLNGDSSFTFSDSSKCIYGVSTESGGKYLIGFGERTIESKDGQLVFTAGSERYYDCVSKLVSVLTESDGHAKYKGSGADDVRGSYINLFETEQALFLTAELSKTNRMRDKEYSFGILPFPKYDEAQENYYNSPFYGTPCFSIPVTVKDPERVAAIGDALTYLSWEMVLPTFRKTTLEQKNLRNEDSIEMLNIIIESSVPDLTQSYNVGKELISEVQTQMKTGSDSVASIVASHETAILETIKEING